MKLTPKHRMISKFLSDEILSSLICQARHELLHTLQENSRFQPRNNCGESSSTFL